MNFNEATLSQLPAMRVLHNLGWEYISRQDVRQQREGNSSFLLTNTLKEQLTNINGPQFKERDIEEAIRELRPGAGDLLENNLKIYRRLVDGTDIDLMDDKGSSAFIPFKYIDWENCDNNKFHCACEFDASEGRKHIRLDIVLFINGIPIAAIECKKPEISVKAAHNQIERYQKSVPGLFSFIQFAAAINKDKGKYSATGIKEVRWSVWREEAEENLGFKPSYISEILTADINEKVLQKMESDINPGADASNPAGKKGIADNKQNRLLISLFSRERLLDLLRNFVIAGKKSKKIALAHQYFVVKNALVRVEENRPDEDGNNIRNGGVVWHTQGSGKSTSMIMLIKNLKRHLGEQDPRVILVTDRLELNDQMKDNLKESDLMYTEAKNGKELQDIILNKKETVILANVHKFSKAVEGDVSNPSENIFLLVDECHRTQYGDFARDMRILIPNGCYIGFTGTPLLERYKHSTFRTFGEFIQPVYPISRALEDGTVVPLYYEGRDFKDLDISDEEIDKATDEATAGLNSVEEKAIKKKFSDVRIIRELPSTTKKIAEDIANHYANSVIRSIVPNDDIKAQLIVASKAHAVLYHYALKECGVRSRVVISPPGHNEDEEGHTVSINKPEALALVKEFWEKEVVVDGRSEKAYERKVIREFKEEPDPKILVVVDKLITGFDAPKNTILYLCRSLKDHTLLQAIARVNRTYPKKERGYIVDYTMTFGNLKKALNEYDELGGYSSEDLVDTLFDIYMLLDDFGNVYGSLKGFLGEEYGVNADLQWESILGNIMKTRSEDEFQRVYKEFAELLSKLSSVPSFIKKYKNEFAEINKILKLGAQVNAFLVRCNSGEKSDDYLEAERLLLAALGENLDANGFRVLGKRVRLQFLRYYESPGVREDRTVYRPTPDTDPDTDPNSDPGTDTDPHTVSDTDPNTDPNSDPGTDTDPHTVSDTDPNTDPNSDPGTDTDPHTDPDTDSDTDTNSDSSADPDTDSDTSSDSGADPDTDSDTDTSSDSDADPGTDSDTDTSSDSGADPDTDSDTDTSSDFGADPGTDSDTDTSSDSGADPGTDSDTDTTLDGRDSFTSVFSHLKELERRNEELVDSHPEFSKKMSELIQEALDKHYQLALDFSKQTTKLKEAERNVEELARKLNNRDLVRVPDGLKGNERANEYYHTLRNVLPEKKVNTKEMEEEFCVVSEGAYRILEGEDNQGWSNNIDQEKKVRMEVIKKIWGIEKNHNNFLGEKDTEIADKMLDIARARASSPHERTNGYN